MTDFNKFFWSIWGVNNRVYKTNDIFRSVQDNTDELLSEDEVKEKANTHKLQKRFLNDPDKLKLDKYHSLNHKENGLFQHIMKTIFDNNKHVEFYAAQIGHLIFNYRFIGKFIDDKHMLTQFSFQLAYIVEHMNYKEFDTKLMNEIIESNSFECVLNKCQENTKYSLDYALACGHENFSEYILKGFSIKLKEVYAESFITYISEWKNQKSLPGFSKLLLIMFFVIKDSGLDTDTGKSITFIQLLIGRAVVYLKTFVDIPKEVIEKFDMQYYKFREELKQLYSAGKIDEIKQLQESYLLIDDEIEGDKPTKEELECFMEKQTKFLMNLQPELKDKRSMAHPYEEDITSLFQLKKYDEVIELLNQGFKVDKTERTGFEVLDKWVRFIIAIKVEESITESFKALDRALYGTYSHLGIKSQKTKLVKLIKDENDINNCINLINIEFKKMSTFD